MPDDQMLIILNHPKKTDRYKFTLRAHPSPIHSIPDRFPTRHRKAQGSS